MTQARYTYRAAALAGTERPARELAARLPAGTVVALDGALGAGKTRLVQAIAAAEGVDRREVVSPTFVLMHEYHGRRPIYHLDAYRMRDADEFDQLGAHEYFAPPNLVFIEWAERVIDCLPKERIDITITVAADDSREFEIVGRGSAYAAIVAGLSGSLG
jgi:tRNA threonylcarbamoyladenosine biosynthesis protein TsaE